MPSRSQLAIEEVSGGEGGGAGGEGPPTDAEMAARGMGDGSAARSRADAARSRAEGARSRQASP